MYERLQIFLRKLYQLIYRNLFMVRFITSIARYKWKVYTCDRFLNIEHKVVKKKRFLKIFIYVYYIHGYKIKWCYQNCSFQYNKRCLYIPSIYSQIQLQNGNFASTARPLAAFAFLSFQFNVDAIPLYTSYLLPGNKLTFSYIYLDSAC